MDYSKWKKLLIILTIINLIWIFYNRVFASTDIVIEAPEQYTFTLANKFDSYSYSYIFYNPQFVYSNTTAMSFYFVASKTPITFRQAMATYGGVSYLTTYIKTLDNSQFYMYSQNASSNNTFLQNISSFNSYVNSSASLYNSNSAGFTFEDARVTTNTQFNNIVGLYVPTTIQFENGDVAIPDNIYKKPTFDNSDSEIQSLDFDYVFVNPHDFGIENKLYLKILEVTNVVNNPEDLSQNIYYYNDLTFALDNKSKYIKEFFDSETYYYAVPYSALKLKKDNSYYFVLTSNGNQINQTQGEILENDTIFDIILVDTENLITTQDEILHSIINNNPSQNTDDNINNNLPRPGYNNQDTNVNIPGMNIDLPNDITENGFNAIFNSIYNAIYYATQPSPGSDHAEKIKINIPFVNYEFEINPMFTVNLLNNYPIVLNLIQTFYLFVISYYIVNDIRKTVEKIKSGDIMTHTDTNIKADML